MVEHVVMVDEFDGRNEEEEDTREHDKVLPAIRLAAFRLLVASASWMNSSRRPMGASSSLSRCFIMEQLVFRSMMMPIMGLLCCVLPHPKKAATWRFFERIRWGTCDGSLQRSTDKQPL
jgi:hypothetical protein